MARRALPKRMLVERRVMAVRSRSGAAHDRREHHTSRSQLGTVAKRAKVETTIYAPAGHELSKIVAFVLQY
jgi:hypothetical protein